MYFNFCWKNDIITFGNGIISWAKKSEKQAYFSWCLEFILVRTKFQDYAGEDKSQILMLSLVQ